MCTCACCISQQPTVLMYIAEMIVLGQVAVFEFSSSRCLNIILLGLQSMDKVELMLSSALILVSQ